MSSLQHTVYVWEESSSHSSSSLASKWPSQPPARARAQLPPAASTAAEEAGLHSLSSLQTKRSALCWLEAQAFAKASSSQSLEYPRGRRSWWTLISQRLWAAAQWFLLWRIAHRHAYFPFSGLNGLSSAVMINNKSSTGGREQRRVQKKAEKIVFSSNWRGWFVYQKFAPDGPSIKDGGGPRPAGAAHARRQASKRARAH